MIPLAIAIGIIEDKIANDLTSKDTKARECLEDVKAKISRHKPTEYQVKMLTETQDKKIKQSTEVVEDVKIQDGFLIRKLGKLTIGTSIKILTSFEIYERTSEDDYVEGTIRGLKDLGE